MSPTQTQTIDPQGGVLPRIGTGPVVRNHNAPARPRNRALAMFVGAALLIPTVAYLADQAGRLSGSTIPASEQHIDTSKYKIEDIPGEGAFDFAAQVDPNHDPRNGVARFQDQLGYQPEPGDAVAVPIAK